MPFALTLIICTRGTFCYGQSAGVTPVAGVTQPPVATGGIQTPSIPDAQSGTNHVFSSAGSNVGQSSTISNANRSGVNNNAVPHVTAGSNNTGVPSVTAGSMNIGNANTSRAVSGMDSFPNAAGTSQDAAGVSKSGNQNAIGSGGTTDVSSPGIGGSVTGGANTGVGGSVAGFPNQTGGFSVTSNSRSLPPVLELLYSARNVKSKEVLYLCLSRMALS